MYVFGRETERVWECKRHVEGGWVGSKLQKKLIKNGKEERGDRNGRKQLWVDRGGERGRKMGEKKV